MTSDEPGPAITGSASDPDGGPSIAAEWGLRALVMVILMILGLVSRARPAPADEDPDPHTHDDTNPDVDRDADRDADPVANPDAVRADREGRPTLTRGVDVGTGPSAPVTGAPAAPVSPPPRAAIERRRRLVAVTATGAALAYSLGRRTARP